MKRLFFPLLVILFLNSCKKTTTSNAVNGTFKYEVLCSSGKWTGQYFDENGDVQIVGQNSGWSYTGNVPTKPFTTIVQVYPDPLILTGGIKMTVNIYYNGTIVRTNSVTISDQVTSLYASYVIQ